MGMNINLSFSRGFLRIPENIKDEEDIKKNLEYVPQELTPEEIKEEEPGNMQPKTPTTPSKSEMDAFLQNYEQMINNPNVGWKG